MNSSSAQPGENHTALTNGEKDSTTTGNSSHKTIGFRERLSHLTWAWFTFPQSTGGIAILLGNTPHRFNGLDTIGIVVFIFNIVVFLCLSAAMTMRFVLFPEKIKKSFTHPTECFFFPSFWLSIATIIGGIQIYGVPRCGPWLIVAVRVLFWMYTAITLMQSIVGYLVFAVNTPINALKSNPLPWLFTTFCAMLTGTIAGVIAADQPPEQRLPIIVCGCAMQGLGYIVCLMVVSLYFYHLLQEGLPPPNLRPGMFMPIGVGGFTIVALIELARAVPPQYGYFIAHPMAREILLVVSLFTSIFIWIFTFWMFMLAFVANMLCLRSMSFKLTWWAIIFPNVGFTLGTIDIGEELESPGILWVSTAMTILLVAFWLLDMALSVKAVLSRRVMWPGQDEDKED